MAFSPDGRYFIAAGYIDSANVYDFKTKNLVKKIAVNADKGSGSGMNIAFSPDSKWVAFGQDNRVATVHKTSDWQAGIQIRNTGRLLRGMRHPGRFLPRQ
ncbi:MAG: hypothetical protein WDN75_16445 [Bacteroidota bacterium]